MNNTTNIAAETKNAVKVFALIKAVKENRVNAEKLVAEFVKSEAGKAFAGQIYEALRGN